MRLHLQSMIVVEVVGVGRLALAGIQPKFSADGKSFEGTVVQFILEYEPQPHPDFPDKASLAMLWWGQEANPKKLIGQFQRANNVSSTNGHTELLFFTREVRGQLLTPWRFLHGTANTITRELLEVQREFAHSRARAKQKNSA